MPAPQRRTPAAGRIRAVLLDVDGTLYRQGPLRSRMAVELALFALRRPAQGARTLRILRTFRHLREQLRGELPGEPSREALQYERPAAALGLSPGEIREVVADWMEQRPLRHLRSCVRPGLGEFLEACRAAGVEVGALSDYPPQPKLAALGILPFFGLALCSTNPEINAFKPSPAGILSACRSWRLSPEEVLTVGDRRDVDAAAAQAAGAPFVLIGRTGGGAARDFHGLARFAGIPAQG